MPHRSPDGLRVMEPSAVLAALFVLTNLAAFGVMLQDKARARRTGARRISEGTLFFLAAMLGSAGVLLGMFVFRHKTRKWRFIVGIPALLVQNLALLYVISLSLNL